MVDYRLYLPMGANIPPGWIVESNLYYMLVQMPSRTTPGKFYNVKVDLETRQIIDCVGIDGEECKGFHFRGYCFHSRGLIFVSYKKEHKKGVAFNSIQSFYQLDPEQLEGNYNKLYNALISHGPQCNRLLSRITGLPINIVTARIKELRDKLAMVTDAGNIWDNETARNVKIWRAIGWG